MLFERVDRVVVLVDDFDGTRTFFADLFDVAFDPTVRDDEHQLQVAHTGRFGFEVGSPMSDGHPLAEQEKAWLAEHGPGLRMIVVKVSDMAAALQHFARRGIEPIGRIRVGDAEEAFFDPRDTMGVAICLNHYPDPHPMSAQGARLTREPEAGEVRS